MPSPTTILLAALCAAYIAMLVAGDNIVSWFQDRIAEHHKRRRHRQLQATIARIKATLESRSRLK
jgi:hypothetical protein